MAGGISRNKFVVTGVTVVDRSRYFGGKRGGTLNNSTQIFGGKRGGTLNSTIELNELELRVEVESSEASNSNGDIIL
jgi:hypothetical protein